MKIERLRTLDISSGMCSICVEMQSGDPYGTEWSADEVEAVVSSYLEMLSHEIAGTTYVKARFNEALQKLTGRTRPSIELKFQNISAVLQFLGLQWIRGYKPRANFQRLLLDRIEVRLESGLAQLALGFSEAGPELRYGQSLQLLSPPVPTYIEPHTNPDLQRLVRKFDPASRDQRNRALGKAGEELVLSFERHRLLQSRPELARKVEWISQSYGDGAGYDIRSYNDDGTERLIEVKTTAGYVRTPFYISANELEFSDEHPSQFRLIRVFEFGNRPKAFELAPPLSHALVLRPDVFRASPR